MPKLPRPSGKDMLAFLEKRGFGVVRTRGSHFVIQKDELRTTIPIHGNEPLKIGTLRGILRDRPKTLPTFVLGTREKC